MQHTDVLVVFAGNKATKASKRKAKETASSSAAARINELACLLCGSAESTDGNIMVLCSFALAHAADARGYHQECLEELSGGGLDGDWKCPDCTSKEAEQGLFEVESILNKRCALLREHTPRCVETNSVATGKCRCRSAKKQATKYHIKWKGCPLEQSTWEPEKEAKKTRDLFNSFKASIEGKLYCDGCKCVHCLCPREAQLLHARGFWPQ